MSYCRFSSDDWRSDVYVYEHFAGGFVTHVASNKPRGYVPRTLSWPPYAWKTGTLWRRIGYAVWFRLHWWSYNLQMAYIEVMPRRQLGLPSDGETYSDPDAEECVARLLGLRKLGYCVPQGAINALMEEAAEEHAGPLPEEVKA